MKRALLFGLLTACSAPFVADMGGAAPDHAMMDVADLAQPDIAVMQQPDMTTLGCTFVRDCGDGTKWNCCGGKCTPKNDLKNCGTCGTSCGNDPAAICCRDHTSPGVGPFKCYNARVGPWCGLGCAALCSAVERGSLCCDGVCRYTTEDTENCGGCGIKCAPGQSCRFGSCR